MTKGELEKAANKWADNMVWALVDMKRKANDDERDFLVQEYKDLQELFTNDLEKENAELKAKNKWYSEQVCNKECAEVWGLLTKAKGVINIATEGIKYWGIVGGTERPFEKQAEELFNLFLDKAEQFLKELDK